MTASLRIARPRLLAFFAFEGGIVFAVLYGLAHLTLHLFPGIEYADPGRTVAGISGLFLIVLVATQLTTFGVHAPLGREIILMGVVSVVAGLLCSAALWALFLDFNRLHTILILEGSVAVPAAVAVWRWLTYRIDFLSPSREKILIVGTSEIALQIGRWLCMEHLDTYAVLGFVDEGDERIGSVLAMGVEIQANYGSLVSYGASRADRVIVALDEKRGKLPVRGLMELRLLGIEIEDATSFYERVSGKIAVENMLPSWLIFSEGFKTSPLRRFLKRCIDIFHSIALLIGTVPLMLFTALAIKLDSRGPVLYRQKRMGLQGREFNVLKFRSMQTDAESKSGPTWAQRNDPRVTRVGRIIRLLRIDELPQLINVLRGEMSFVGPRPERRHFVERLERKIPYYGLRLTVRPGVTGWAQVEHHYAATDDDALEKLKYDLYYIKNSSPLFDLWVVLKTFKVVLLGSGAR